MRKATVVRFQPVWIEANQATYWKLQACVVFIDRAIRAIFPFLPSAVHLSRVDGKERGGTAQL